MNFDAEDINKNDEDISESDEDMSENDEEEFEETIDAQIENVVDYSEPDSESETVELENFNESDPLTIIASISRTSIFIILNIFNNCMPLHDFKGKYCLKYGRLFLKLIALILSIFT